MGNTTANQWRLDSIVADPLAFSQVSVSYRRSDAGRRLRLGSRVAGSAGTSHRAVSTGPQQARYPWLMSVHAILVSGPAPAGARRGAAGPSRRPRWPHYRRSPKTMRCASPRRRLLPTPTASWRLTPRTCCAAQAANTPTAMIDRLALDPSASKGIAAGCARSPGYPTRWERCCVAIRCPTGWRCASSEFRSA